MTLEISDELRTYLGLIIEEDIEKNRDHLIWLTQNPNEPDRDLQIAETEGAIELGTEAASFFPPPPIEPLAEAEPRPPA